MTTLQRIQRLESLVEINDPLSSTKKSVSKAGDKVKIVRMENGFYWLVDIETEEYIDGDKRLWVVKDMAKRWGLKIIGTVHRQ